MRSRVGTFPHGGYFWATVLTFGLLAPVWLLHWLLYLLATTPAERARAKRRRERRARRK